MNTIGGVVRTIGQLLQLDKQIKNHCINHSSGATPRGYEGIDEGLYRFFAPDDWLILRCAMHQDLLI